MKDLIERLNCINYSDASRGTAKEAADALECLNSTLESRDRNIKQVVEENKRLTAERDAAFTMSQCQCGTDVWQRSQCRTPSTATCSACDSASAAGRSCCNK